MSSNMGKKKTTEEFIAEAQSVHGDKYDYSNVVYINTHSKVVIICKVHGEFEQTPSKHLVGGCRKCGRVTSGNKQRKTQEKFIEEAINIHGNIYDYSKVNYVNTDTKVIIICKKHGEFEQIPHSHSITGNGCHKCGDERVRNKLQSKQEEFIEKATKIHGDRYNYSKVNYNGCFNKVLITCLVHGDFEQQPASHIAGRGCPKCAAISRTLVQTDTQDTVIQKFRAIHGARYDYSLVQYEKSCIPVKIICRIHGIFLQKPNNHISEQSGCPKCAGTYKRNTLDFKEDAIKVHDTKYDYSKSVFNGRHSKLIITCNIHGDFEQEAGVHLSGGGCNKCGIISAINKTSKSQDQFIKDASSIHGNKYDYSKVYYVNCKTKVIIICKNHGEFKVTPSNHLKSRECPKCYPQHSKIQIHWLHYIQMTNSYTIHHAESDNGEYKIPETNYKVDGYCKETNTVYEFHGDFWHGNPKRFNPNDTNRITKTTFGELYQRTQKKKYKIQELGYNYVEMWEHDWKRAIKSVIKIQRMWRKKYGKTSE